MVKLNKKGLERIKSTKITDVNYRIDESGYEYIEICCGGEVEKIPYNEENRLWVMSLLKRQEYMAQDVSLSLATLKLQAINCKLFYSFAIIGTGISLLQNMPVTLEYGTMCSIGGTVAVMVPAVLETLTERKIQKINRLSLPGVRRI